VAAWQQVSHEWWNRRRERYELFVSEFVLAEIGEGDSAAVQKRQELVVDLPILAANDAALWLAGEIMSRAKLPVRVADDVAHIAVSSVHGMDYLLTWNCAHIANPHWQMKLEAIIKGAGFAMPVMCTPQAFLEGE